MKIVLPGGKYIIAVSGGVDSMVLLDLLAKQPDIELVVAHFNHGIRTDSSKDEELASRTAKSLNLALEVGCGYLGPKASEATARKARYNFLLAVKQKHQAKAIITAHHLDDHLETALINLIRGTGRKGLVAISTNKQVLRPLLKYSKSEILAYARKEELVWNEDKTNCSNDYLRNYLRNNVLNRLSAKDRQEMLENIDKIAKTDSIIDSQIAKISQFILENGAIDRRGFCLLPTKIGDELVVHWLRQKRLRDYDRKTISRVSNAIRTNQTKTTCVVKNNLLLTFTAKTAKFEHTV